MGKVVTLDELKCERERLRTEKKKVVFTNGCFDIIHRGHVEYLKGAKAMGDALIVGVNSDSSVRRIKGPGRPIVNEADRMYVLATLIPVDYVCLFDEETPYELIAAIVPDVLVKGSDWDVGSIIGRDIVEAGGGKVATIQFVQDRSTSSIIKKILERCP
ncbi:MAG: D-glycero-beta-D-manno-heptose 1-phosphate adenylyltransferase [Bacteroidota bacterium]